MSGEGYTPGPWRIHRYAVCVVEDCAGRSVATTGGYSDNTSEGAYAVENEANARLIAAAPELFEYVESSAQNGCATAIALIAKAKGDA